MKTRILLLAACLSAGPLTAADLSPAEADWQALEAAAGPNLALLKLPRRELTLGLIARDEKIVAAARHYFDSYPTDPRRWEAILKMCGVQRAFLLNPGAATAEEFKFDEAARKAWREECLAWRARILAAPDATPRAREGAAAADLSDEIDRCGRQLKGNPALDLGPLRARLDAFLTAYPNGTRGGGLVESFIWVATRQSPEKADALWGEFAQSRNPAVRERALKALLLVEAKSKPLELSFTAFDGRAVDLAKLRGKVVLVDFWATWCGPCVAELPNVRKVYDAYHGKGFEVVGISLDLEQDRQKLTDFLRSEGMPWPQYYDGKGWKNELAVRYGIHGIPAMFLLDQSGKIVSTNARGEALEREVKRLLKI